MNPEEKTKMVCDAWRIAAGNLSIRIEVPYQIKTATGKDVACIAYLPDFGGPKGMVVGVTVRPAYRIDEELKSAAESQGVYYSFINAQVYEHYNEATFKEALTDWGFFGDEARRPSWLQKPRSE